MSSKLFFSFKVARSTSFRGYIPNPLVDRITWSLLGFPAQGVQISIFFMLAGMLILLLRIMSSVFLRVRC